ncbi:hypothetical protein [Aeromonas encheleia]|uniref:Uncharacterized protein n=1 Tax=Aeromonas encheleia TaxID=73010 RepID=A0AAE9MDY8_9GAMM|nr:hypothetical protein [Aeromonas encheleia]USV56474.1 hypothetical protein NHF51_14080 [Aeromonas encheleia]
MRFVSTLLTSTQARPLLSRLGLLPRWPRGKQRQHHYRLQIRCQDRADMELVLGIVAHSLQPAGLHPMQSLRPGRGDGRELVLNLSCTPSQRRYLVQFVHQVGVAHPVRWELHPRQGTEPRLN